MRFQEAIIKSIRSYYEGNSFQNIDGIKKVKYSKDYFDSFEEEAFGETSSEDIPKDGKIDPKRQATLSAMMKLNGEGGEKENESGTTKAEE
jgi:hypothetical protein